MPDFHALPVTRAKDRQYTSQNEHHVYPQHKLYLWLHEYIKNKLIITTKKWMFLLYVKGSVVTQRVRNYKFCTITIFVIYNK